MGVKMTLTAAFLNLDGTDVSGDSKKIELTVDVDEKDVTTFASLGWKEVVGGLKSGTLAADLMQDVAAGGLDERMWTKLGNLISFEVRLSNAPVSANNPKYTGSVLVKSWKPIGGSPGDVADVSISYPTSGPVLRAVA